ncbi:MAG: esterase-like activity of phytase family protein [Alphaproteobacteria bacterium]
MRRTLATVVSLGSLAALAAPVAAEPAVRLYTSSDPALAIETVAYEGGKTVGYTIGIGSGAFRRADEPPMTFWTVSDRGPNFTCADVKAVMGLDGKALCGETRNARIYPLPGYAPTIYRVELKADGTFAVIDAIPLKDGGGKAISGMPNTLTVATTENPIDGAGRPLSQSASSVDAEGIVRMADGTFWIGEENAPSLLRVAADGRIMERLVPVGSEKDFADAGYKVTGALPAIYTKRQANRGIESVAVSPDGRFLYTIMQNPLAHPDAKAYAQARNTRVLKLDSVTHTLLGEYVYQLDLPDTFRLDPSDKQNAPRISEMTALATDRLLVLERTDGTTKLYEVALQGATDILGGKWSDPVTSPSLELSNDLSGTGIVPLGKTLRFDSADFPQVPVKLEGVALLGDGSVAIVNDNDFGITGEVTKVVVLTGSGIKAGM